MLERLFKITVFINEMEVHLAGEFTSCFLQNLMVAARGYGLHTCPQAIFADVPGAVYEVLPIPNEEIIVCGMSLGYIDDKVNVNNLETERASVEEFATFLKS